MLRTYRYIYKNINYHLNNVHVSGLYSSLPIIHMYLKFILGDTIRELVGATRTVNQQTASILRVRNSKAQKTTKGKKEPSGVMFTTNIQIILFCL
jgi:hypothetical protein